VDGKSIEKFWGEKAYCLIRDIHRRYTICIQTWRGKIHFWRAIAPPKVNVRHCTDE